MVMIRPGKLDETTRSTMTETTAPAGRAAIPWRDLKTPRRSASSSNCKHAVRAPAPQRPAGDSARVMAADVGATKKSGINHK